MAVEVAGVLSATRILAPNGIWECRNATDPINIREQYALNPGYAVIRAALLGKAIHYFPGVRPMVCSSSARASRCDSWACSISACAL
jgi:hypothetical protein